MKVGRTFVEKRKRGGRGARGEADRETERLGQQRHTRDSTNAEAHASTLRAGERTPKESVH